MVVIATSTRWGSILAERCRAASDELDCNWDYALPMKIIVCMSTTPPRAPYIKSVIDRLLAQTRKPDEIRIYVPDKYRRFPGTPKFPKLPDNVKICSCDEDFGPATKILPALKEFPPDQILIYCDDNIDYDSNLIERLLLLSAVHPGSCIADQGRGWTRFVRDLIRDKDW